MQILFKKLLLSILFLTTNAVLYEDIPHDKCIGKLELPFRHNRLVLIKKYKRFVFKNFDKLPYETVLENDNLNLVIKMKYDGEVPTVEMGPLEGIGSFRFDSMYFHWVKEAPPTYAYKNIPFPGEMHLLFYDTKYENFMQAIDHRNSIAVFAFGVIGYLKEYEDLLPLHLYDDLQENLKHVRTGYQTIKIRNQALMDWIVDEENIETYKYYTYNGSLVRYACGNDVIWIDFRMPIAVKGDFIKEFYLLQTFDHQPLMDQFDTYPTPNGFVFKPYVAKTHKEEINMSLVTPSNDFEKDTDYSSVNLSNRGYLNLSSNTKVVLLIIIFQFILSL